MKDIIFWHDRGTLTLSNYIDCHPYNSCPYCNKTIKAEIAAVHDEPFYEERVIELYNRNSGINENITENIMVGYKTDIVYKCTNYECGKIFIVHYESGMKGINGKPIDSRVIKVSPSHKPSITTNLHIDVISEGFYNIYEQSLIAENEGLNQICGMGYRKALEFLIKDYVIYMKANDETFKKEIFIKKQLGQILNQDIESSRIVNMSKRASWIGNDEAHYIRKWEQKDVHDLKSIINVILHEIEMEIIYRNTLDDMPEGVK